MSRLPFGILAHFPRSRSGAQTLSSWKKIDPQRSTVQPPVANNTSIFPRSRKYEPLAYILSTIILIFTMNDTERRTAKRSRFDQTEPETKRASRFDRRSRSPPARKAESRRSRSPIARGSDSPVPSSAKKDGSDPVAAAGQSQI